MRGQEDGPYRCRDYLRSPPRRRGGVRLKEYPPLVQLAAFEECAAFLDHLSFQVDGPTRGDATRESEQESSVPGENGRFSNLRERSPASATYPFMASPRKSGAAARSKGQISLLQPYGSPAVLANGTMSPSLSLSAVRGTAPTPPPSWMPGKRILSEISLDREEIYYFRRGECNAEVAAWRREMRAWASRTVTALGIGREFVLVTFSYVDRYLTYASLENKHWGLAALNREKFQLLCITSLYVAVKVMMPYCSLAAKALTEISGEVCTKDHIEKMELQLMITLQWRMHPPTAAAFVNLLIEMIPEFCSDTSVRERIMQSCLFLIEVAVDDISLVTVRPSWVATVSVLLALDEIFEENKCQLSNCSLAPQTIVEGFFSAVECYTDIDMRSDDIFCVYMSMKGILRN